MAIPLFTVAGHLPAGRHVTDVHEVEVRLVLPFPLSMTRPDLYSRWRSRRQAIAALVPSFSQEWLSGSFASAKRDPGDVDVVTFIQRADIEALDGDDRARLLDLVTGSAAKLRFGTHGFICPVADDADPQRAAYLKARGYWDEFWSYTKTGDERGYLDVRGEP